MARVLSGIELGSRQTMTGFLISKDISTGRGLRPGLRPAWAFLATLWLAMQCALSFPTVFNPSFEENGSPLVCPGLGPINGWQFGWDVGINPMDATTRP